MTKKIFPSVWNPVSLSSSSIETNFFCKVNGKSRSVPQIYNYLKEMFIKVYLLLKIIVMKFVS
jgi:hypothetical protein